MTYGHAGNLANLPNGKPGKSAFVTGTWVIWSGKQSWLPSDRPLRGQVVGPDQDYFPSPDEVFVSLPQTGLTLLLPVTELKVIFPQVEGISTHD
ncbi:MAG TPA: hypothetical protein VFQ77_10220 [Pseudonocardiaceae bacterium]|jgi:hypothetical protein|nr:hypothetical protein [Pseudonocardiaceae bacterium]